MMEASSLRDDPLLTEIPEVDGFKVLEPCVLYSKLGEGGMGAVYRGRHLNLNIDVAVKCLRRSLADQSTTFVQRFQREARLAAGIHHQNLVQVYDVSQKRGVHYLVMEFVSGETARDRVRRKGRLGIDESLRIAIGAASGLSVAHARRIVHRDVKPDNVLIGRDGSVKVSDLGLAKAMEGEMEVSLTQGVMGTPQYMAPEQWDDSSKVTPAADVWALGATIYFLLAGKDPIQAGTMQQALKRICFEPFPDIRSVRPEVPDDVVRLIQRCVARSLSERFADCGQVLAELKRFVGHDNGELVSGPDESTEMGATLVSPPPPETMAKILLSLDAKEKSSRAESTYAAPAAVTTPMASPEAESPAPAAPRPRKKIALAIAGGVALVGIASYFALRGGADSDKGSKTAESNHASEVPSNSNSGTTTTLPLATPMQVRFEKPPGASGAFESAVKRFKLAGKIEGSDKAIHARIREAGGKVTVEPGAGQFALDLRFDRDGKYTLELDGELLQEPKSFTILVDSTAPTIQSHSESPKVPLPRGSEVTLSLAFDEVLAQAEMNGRSASVDEREARATLTTPDDGKSWKVSWKVRDRMQNESQDSFVLALQPEAGPPPPPVPDSAPSSTLPAPPGCIAIGEESIPIGGRTWAKHVQHQFSGIHMVLIPPGSFQMGSNVASDNAPAPRTVTISRGFYMSENEVSEAEYAKGLRGVAPASQPSMPVSNLSWSDADRFCDATRLSLPTEAEWEYACRAGRSSAFGFGDQLDVSQAATSELGHELRPCGESKRNDFGLADMHGNLKEYCQDTFVPAEDYAKLGSIDPKATGRSKLRALRGGSKESLSKFCTSACRQGVDMNQKQPDRGLRVILRIP